MTSNINYKHFVNQIIELLYNNDSSESFNEISKNIGKEIYNINGYRGLYKVMNMVEEELLHCDYSNSYLSNIRELEVTWSGICEEWQF
jgi:hypothetical protein